MSTSKKKYTQMYRRAKESSQLFLQRNEVPVFIRRVVELDKKRGKALDIGCASGFYSVFLAQQGYQVTALDYIPAAIEFAKKRASKAGVEINFIEGDITEWISPERYDFILDSGCLHNFNKKDRIKYRQRFPQWLSENANFVLVHFGKRSIFDINYRLGLKVKRATKDETEGFFQPELKLVEFYAEPGSRPLFYYRFRK